MIRQSGPLPTRLRTLLLDQALEARGITDVNETEITLRATHLQTQFTGLAFDVANMQSPAARRMKYSLQQVVVNRVRILAPRFQGLKARTENIVAVVFNTTLSLQNPFDGFLHPAAFIPQERVEEPHNRQ